ncbi:MAG: DUF2304 domain-containing protein [Nocardioides sp.]|nr:DUF2304 domain-containing protein [Nocardioides sp.]
MLRRRRLREKYAALWILVAIATVVLAVAPGLLAWVAQLFGIAVPANLLFFGACMLLLIVSMQHSYEIGRLEERTQTLAEELALLQLEQDAQPRAAREQQGTLDVPSERHEDDQQPDE